MLKNEDFEEDFEVIDQADWYKHASPWGNACIKITMKDIMALLEGRDLCHFDGEYVTYVRFIDDIPLCKELLEIKSPSGGTENANI